MLERFAREEGDRLIKIIKSRVDYSMTEGGDAGPSTIRNSTYAETTPNISSQAIREAKKLEENKVKSAVTPQESNNDVSIQEPINATAAQQQAKAIVGWELCIGHVILWRVREHGGWGWNIKQS